MYLEMKKICLLLAFTAFSLAAVSAAKKQAARPLDIDRTPRLIEIATDNTELILKVNSDGEVLFGYYGKPVSDPSPLTEKKNYKRADLGTEPQAYSVQGGREVREAALAVTHSDGDLNTQLRYVSHKTERKDGATVTTVQLADLKHPFDVRLVYEAYPAEDVIVAHTEITNRESAPVILRNYYSVNLTAFADRYFLNYFYGEWAKEMTMAEIELTHGIKKVSSLKHVRAVHCENPSFILSLDAPLAEKSGDVIAGALAWTGNFDLSFEVDDLDILAVRAGINPYSAEYPLASGETFSTPNAILTFSSEGAGRASRNLHDWARNRNGVYKPEVVCPTLLNSWEGAYFKFDAAVLKKMIDDAADMGLEMFVLDDGWFGNEFPRNSSKAGLGDWQVNEKKLPAGIDDIASYAVSKGLKFGIWIEPEMVNPQSVLAREHPEWVVGNNGREQTTMRQQWLLDLTNPEVQDFVFGVFDNTMKLSPHISYIKWDANRHVENVGSSYLDGRSQSAFWVKYTEGLYKVYERIRKAYPDVMIQACASGGGRVEYGALKYHDEAWTSDNTDALSRIFIQYGMSHIYPAVAMGSHVSAVPNHQTAAVTPLKFRFDVAMSGRLGMELQPKDLSDGEKEFSRRAIADYKRLRPTIMYGDLYRLRSPYDAKGYASSMYVSKDKTRAVLFAYCFKYQGGYRACRLKLDGLDASKRYRLKEINIQNKPIFWGEGKAFGGDYLMNEGIEIPLKKLFSSAVFEIEEVK